MVASEFSYIILTYRRIKKSEKIIFLGQMRKVETLARIANHFLSQDWPCPQVHSRKCEQRQAVESLAAAAGMSRYAFAVHCKELLGQTPFDYVSDWRIAEGDQLLQQGDKKLIEVAQSIGYESDAAYSKAFQTGRWSHTWCVPTECAMIHEFSRPG